MRHTPELWDIRAGEWISRLGDNGKSDHMYARVETTAAFLRGRGLLGKDDAVVDVGCGPGLFVTEFAATARHATGIDYSARFIEFAESHAAKRGIGNVTFLRRDFGALDIDAEGMAGAFDLVFTSITPAVSGTRGLDKLMRMSRRWCYNAAFVHARDDLLEQIHQDVFGSRYVSRWNGEGFYALTNLLWLSGYYPETSYFDEARDETVPPTPRAAAQLASRCGRGGEDDEARILRYLEKHGELRRRSLFRYGVILWDVTRRDGRFS